MLVAWVFQPTGLSAQTTRPAGAPDSLSRALDQLLTGEQRSWQVVGGGLAILQGDTVLYAQGIGFRDREHQLPVTPTTIWGIGSCTKAFTATAIGKLVEQGKVAWDQPVRTYLPDFQLADNHATRHLTVRDLLSHLSGLPGHNLLWISTGFSEEAVYQRLRYLPSTADLRQKYQYSNLMYLVAGRLIERVSGQPWPLFLQRQLLDPIGMRAVYVMPADGVKTGDFSLVYATAESQGETPNSSTSYPRASGSIHTNLTAMTNWMRLNLQRGRWQGKPVIADTVLAEIHKPQVITDAVGPFINESPAMYGLGWGMSFYKGIYQIHHNGGVLNFVTQLSLFPNHQLGILVWNNTGSQLFNAVVTNTVRDALLRLAPVDWSARAKKVVLERPLAASSTDSAAQPDGPPAHSLRAYRGIYTHPAYGELTIQGQGDSLRFRYYQTEGRLRHRQGDTFENLVSRPGIDQQWGNNQFVFGADASGRVVELTISPMPEAGLPISFSRLRSTPKADGPRVKR